MTRTTTMGLVLALATGCGAGVPADGGMQRIELTDKAHKPNAAAQNPAAIQDNSFHGNPAAIQDDSFKPVEQKGDPAAIQDNTFKPVEQKGNPAAIQDNTFKPVEQKGGPAAIQDNTRPLVKGENKAIDPAVARPATDVKIPPMK